jgi:hypothetical protein
MKKIYINVKIKKAKGTKRMTTETNKAKKYGTK